MTASSSRRRRSWRTTSSGSTQRRATDRANDSLTVAETFASVQSPASALGVKKAVAKMTHCGVVKFSSTPLRLSGI